MSIAYFPELYPDELVYSVLARFYEHSGYPAYIFCAEDIFTDRRVRPDIEFINKLKPEITEFLCKDISVGQLVEKHTMFPYYARFMPQERRDKAFKALCSMGGDYNNLLAIPKQRNGEHRHLKYCPLCVKEDRSVYGETYWHRNHQMQGVTVCPRHNCKLVDSAVIISGKASPDLVSAEQEAKKEAAILYGNEVERQLAVYVSEVFQAEVDIKNEAAIGNFLHSKMAGTKYVSVRGEQRNIKTLTADFIEFYKELSEQGLTELWQIQKVLTSYRTNTFEVCQIAMFLNVATKELVSMKLPAKSQEQLFDEKVKQMHSQGIGCNRIAKQLGVSSKTIRDIEHHKYKGTRRPKQYKQPCGAKSMNWEQIDNETLPFVQKAVKHLLGDGRERPHRVTEYAVCRILGLPDKRLRLLPKCRAEVLKHQETQEKYWAREAVWAVSKIQSEGKAPNWKQIRVLTNMRKDNMIACLPYLKNMVQPELYEMLEVML